MEKKEHSHYMDGEIEAGKIDLVALWSDPDFKFISDFFSKSHRIPLGVQNQEGRKELIADNAISDSVRGFQFEITENVFREVLIDKTAEEDFKVYYVTRIGSQFVLESAWCVNKKNNYLLGEEGCSLAQAFLVINNMMERQLVRPWPLPPKDVEELNFLPTPITSLTEDIQAHVKEFLDIELGK